MPQITDASTDTGTDPSTDANSHAGAARDGWITHDRSYVRYEHYVRVMGVTSGSHPRPLAQLRPRRMGRLASAGDELRTDHR